MLDLCQYIIRQSDLHERVAAENVIKFTAMIYHNHFCVKITLKTLSLSAAQFVMSYLIMPKNLSIASAKRSCITIQRKAKEATTHMIGIKLYDYSIV